MAPCVVDIRVKLLSCRERINSYAGVCYLAVEPLTTISTSFKNVIVLLFYVCMLLWQAICQWSEVKNQINKQKQIALVRFVVDSVRRKLHTNTRNKPDNDDNTINMRYIFGAINNNVEGAIVLSTITQ